MHAAECVGLCSIRRLQLVGLFSVNKRVILAVLSAPTIGLACAQQCRVFKNRKLQFSGRQLQISDIKINTKSINGLAL